MSIVLAINAEVVLNFYFLTPNPQMGAITFAKCTIFSRFNDEFLPI